MEASDYAAYGLLATLAALVIGSINVALIDSASGQWTVGEAFGLFMASAILMLLFFTVLMYVVGSLVTTKLEREYGLEAEDVTN
jgi:uncharacterized membrane protein